MTVQDDSSTLDLFRERLASPFIFTFFWVSCTWNWKLLYWFFYEPLKPSLKLQQIPYEWHYIYPFLLTIVIIVVIPWVNNLVELLKRFAGNWFNKWLHSKGWKEMVSNNEHLQILDELSITKSRAHDLTNKYDELLRREKEVQKSLIKEREENSKLLSDIATEKERSSIYEISRNEIKEKQLEAEELHLKAHNEAIELTKELKKSRGAYRQLLFENSSINEKLDGIKVEINTLQNIYKLDSVNNIVIPRHHEVIDTINSLRNIRKILEK